MRDISDFLIKVRPHAMACPEPVAIQYLREAVREWCQRTRMWRVEIDFQTNLDGLGGLCLPEGADLMEIERVWFGTYPLEPISFSGVVGREIEPGSGMPSYYTQVGPNQLRITPANEGDVKMTVFAQPSQSAEEVPDFLYDLYAEQIGYGALRRILMLPNQPFTNPQLAMLNGQWFETALNQNFDANVKGQQRAHGRARSRFV